MNSAKQKLSAGKLVLCMGLRQARSHDIAMIAAECGFDAIYADMQHSPLSLETISALCVGGIRGDLELQRDLVQLGARFIIAGSDVAYLSTAARKDVESLRGLA